MTFFINNRLFIIACLALLSSCILTSNNQEIDAYASAQSKFKACAISEARQKVQNGSAFILDLDRSTDEIVISCLNKLGLESAEIDDEAQRMTKNILLSFMRKAAK